MLTIKHTRLTASPGFRKSLNRTFPGPIIMELAGIAIGVHTATLLAMNTAMTTALGSVPSDSAMVHAIGHSNVQAAVLLITCVSAHVRIHSDAMMIIGLDCPVTEITASAIILPAPVSFNAVPSGTINATSPIGSLSDTKRTIATASMINVITACDMTVLLFYTNLHT